MKACNVMVRDTGPLVALMGGACKTTHSVARNLHKLRLGGLNLLRRSGCIFIFPVTATVADLMVAEGLP